MTTITVTAEHIARGQQDCLRCPVALAITDAIGAAWVGRHTFAIAAPSYIAPLPDAVEQFIRAFDSGEPVQPFSFEIDYPAVAS